MIRRETGIATKTSQLPALEAALRRVDPTMTSADFLRAGTDSPGGAALLERMIDEVTVKETFFFRQRTELDAIDWAVLVDRARASGSDHVRVWVAASASGEEAYTLAILASEAFAPDPASGARSTPRTCHPPRLAQAQRGRYGRRSARALQERTVLDRYFTQEGADVVVGPRLRRMVQFSRQNLVRDFTVADGWPVRSDRLSQRPDLFRAGGGRAGGRLR